jgi:hypothetical protein
MRTNEKLGELHKIFYLVVEVVVKGEDWSDWGYVIKWIKKDLDNSESKPERH